VAGLFFSFVLFFFNREGHPTSLKLRGAGEAFVLFFLTESFFDRIIFSYVLFMLDIW